MVSMFAFQKVLTAYFENYCAMSGIFSFRFSVFFQVQPIFMGRTIWLIFHKDQFPHAIFYTTHLKFQNNLEDYTFSSKSIDWIF